MSQKTPISNDSAVEPCEEVLQTLCNQIKQYLACCFGFKPFSGNTVNRSTTK